MRQVWSNTTKSSVEGSKGLNYPPRRVWSLGPPWWNNQEDGTKSTLESPKLSSWLRLYRCLPCPVGIPGLCWSCFICTSGVWVSSLGAWRLGQNLCLWAVIPSPQDLSALSLKAYMEKNGYWVALCVLWDQKESKTTFFALLDRGGITKIYLCLKALWKVHGFSGLSGSTPVEFLERKDDESYWDAVVSNSRNFGGLKGFWMKSKGFWMKMEEKNRASTLYKSFIIILLLYLCASDPVFQWNGTWKDKEMVLGYEGSNIVSSSGMLIGVRIASYSWSQIRNLGKFMCSYCWTCL